MFWGVFLSVIAIPSSTGFLTGGRYSQHLHRGFVDM